ncbi:DUF2690 domain-containing protein [Dactylosporangium sp. CA-092794]|uniref:DUF2690 domain-containing protein n=1 Tax=Dactylosporangium sp. CA-092794 TaxID=3239929 RepID=UPI003D8D71DE
MLAGLTAAICTTAVATPASAAVTKCTRTSCPYVGQNPETTGCSAGAYAVANTHVIQPSDRVWIGAVNLMYSPGCNTNWTEADSYAQPVDIVVWNTANQLKSKDNLANYGGYGFTPMVNGSYDAGACIQSDRFITCVGQPAVTAHPPFGSF